MENCKDLLNNI